MSTTVSLESRVFRPYRAVGVVTEDVPFVLNTLGAKNFVTVSIGRAFQVFDTDKLSLAIISPQLTRRIRALAAYRTTTFAACDADVLVWERATQVGVMRGHTDTVELLHRFGDVLVSVARDHTMRVWNMATHTEIRCIQLSADFVPTALLHPHTYLNKLVLGSQDGRLQLWNIRTGKMVHEFPGWPGTPVMCLAQSPAVDVVAVGLGDGRVTVHNLLSDETLMTFRQTDGAVTAATFRTDGGAGAGVVPLLATGSASGQIHMWNLQERRLHHTMPEAHEDRVVSLEFLPKQPVLVSAGADNALRMWLLDGADGSARLLRSREGHKAPPTRIRFVGGDTVATMADGADAAAFQILSAGQDQTLRVFHTLREQQNREMSQGPLAKRARMMHVKVDTLRLPCITAFAHAEPRSRDWSDVLTCHQGDASVYTWRFENRAVGPHVLRPDNPHSGKRKRRNGQADVSFSATGTLPTATAVAISACGNMGVVGDAAGGIFVYNMQSGMARGSFPSAAEAEAEDPATLALSAPARRAAEVQRRAKEAELAEKAKRAEGEEPPAHAPDGDHRSEAADGHAHAGLVSGLAVDALNQVLVSSGLDGTLKWWDFTSRALLHTEEIGSAVSQVELHRDSGLLAVVADDLTLRVYDVTNRRLVRRFRGHVNRVTDVAFSPDARWLVSASSDGSLRVWDVPNARCVDWLRTPRAPTSVAFSPTGEFLATSHVGHVGLFLWLNRTRYEDVFLDSEPQRPVRIGLPAPVAASAGEDTAGDAAEARGAGDEAKGTGMGPAAAASRAPVWATAGSDSSDVDGSDGSDDEGGSDGSVHPHAALTLTLQDKVEAGHPRPLFPGAVTLSTLPRNRWATLAHADQIRERNKPIKPPQKPQSAPFFLTSLPGVGEDVKFVPVDPTAGGDGEAAAAAAAAPSASRVLGSKGSARSATRLQQLLAAPASDKSMLAVEEYLAGLSAAEVELELRSLCLGKEDEQGVARLLVALRFFRWRIHRRHAFQVVQAQLRLFLDAHEDVLASRPDLASAARACAEAMDASWSRLQSLLHSNLCMVQLLTGVQNL